MKKKVSSFLFLNKRYSKIIHLSLSKKKKLMKKNKKKEIKK